MKRIKYPRKKKINYSTNIAFNIEYDYKKITVNDRLKTEDYIFLITNYNNFMRYKPPCKKCLVCNMCIIERDPITSIYTTDPYLYIKVCKKLKHFVSCNNSFSIY